MENKILVIILTHGRAENISTVRALKKCGYTGEIVYLIDDEDATINEYKKRYGDQVEVFNKKKYADMIDEMDNFNNRTTITHARNASYDIAQKRGYRYFIQLDDDYTGFSFKFNHKYEYKDRQIKNINDVFMIMARFLNKTNAIVVCMAQNGDFLGGGNGSFGKTIKLRRKAMNSFLCDTKKRLWWIGRQNEDVNTYVGEGNKGVLFFTIHSVSLNHKATQSTKGGMSELYRAQGTYVKSFYSVMMRPSCVKIAMMGETHRRMHHKVIWKKAIPVIIEEKHKKTV